LVRVAAAALGVRQNTHPIARAGPNPLEFALTGVPLCELDEQHRFFSMLEALLGDLGSSAGRP